MAKSRPLAWVRPRPYGRLMEVVGSYEKDGYVHLKSLIPVEIAQAYLRRLAKDLGRAARPLVGKAGAGAVLTRPALEIHGEDYPAMLFFLWGLTPLVGGLVGRELLPTFAYFRAYRAGDLCRVHSDREACQFSLSLTLDYSDGKAWELQVGGRHVPGPRQAPVDDFGGEAYASIAMAPGDAVLYQGLHRRHARLAPNPNRWSAHLFLHWVDRDGDYRDQAFDQSTFAQDVKIDFGR